MAVVAILRETVRALDEADDLRKYSPSVAELKRHVMRVIEELEAEKRGPPKGQGSGTEPPKL